MSKIDVFGVVVSTKSVALGDLQVTKRVHQYKHGQKCLTCPTILRRYSEFKQCEACRIKIGFACAQEGNQLTQQRYRKSLKLLANFPKRKPIK